MWRSTTVIFLVLALILITGGPSVPYVVAQTPTVDQLKSQIGDRTNRLQEIEKEIAAFQAELGKVGSQRKTLQNAINQLELERKKIGADLSYTENRIGFTDLEISKLTLEIEATEQEIDRNKDAIGEIIGRISESDRESLLEVMLRHKNLSEFWGAISTLEEIRGVMRDQVAKLNTLRVSLEEKLDEQEDKRDRLAALRDEYSDQQEVLENNKSEKDQLLKQTRNKEANYQSILREKQKARETIVTELRTFESQLQFILDPNTIPPPGTRVFSWPLASITITQYFGGTEFARRNPGIYAGRAYHPGVDFGAPRGTKIFAPLGGTVRATGNTDAFPGCYSWGKWTLIDHPNGLSTLYAHQDTISVTPGQTVQTGDIIGYTGNTGYSTGPHLHFTVYAKAGVSVRKFSEIKTATNCGAATTPVAATDAYIDPMNYLPAL
jgi:murein DD-endopeptidase MepM/ murein hydrolase activator NlpD